MEVRVSLFLALSLAAAPLQTPAPVEPMDVVSPIGVNPVRDKVAALKGAGDWAGLVEWMETLPAAQREPFLRDWELALCRDARWQRLLAVCDEALARREGGKAPRFVPERAYRATALDRLGRTREALEAYTLDTTLQGSTEDFQGACWCAENLGDWKALEKLATAYLGRHPAKGEAHGYQGEALTRQGRYKEAEPCLRKAVERDPALVFSWTNLATCLNGTARYGEAEEAASRALARDPGNGDALANRARARVGQKRYREAREDFTALLALPGIDPAVAANARLNLRGLDAALAKPRPKVR